MKNSKKCDTIIVNDELPNQNKFKFFVKFRQIINKKVEYQLAFPEKFESH